MPLSEDRQIQILLEEATPSRDPTLDLSDEEREFRKGVRRDTEVLLKAGIEIQIPTTQPSIRDQD